MPYIGNSPGTGTRNRFIFTATASQTTFSGTDDNGKTLAYSDGDYVDVYLNGICLVPVDDYAATSKTSIVLTVGAAASDTLEVVAYDIATIADTVSKANGGTFEGEVNMLDTLTVGNDTQPRIAGQTSDFGIGTIGGEFKDSGITLQRFQSGNLSGPSILLGKSRGANIGDMDIVQDGDELGKIRFYGSDGNNMNSYGAEIEAFVDGTPGAGDMPGKLVFSVTSAGNSATNNGMTLTSNNQLRIGGLTGNSFAKLQVNTDHTPAVPNFTSGEWHNPDDTDGVAIYYTGANNDSWGGKSVGSVHSKYKTASTETWCGFDFIDDRTSSTSTHRASVYVRTRNSGSGDRAVWKFSQSGALLPLTDNAYDLGSGSLRLDDIYATNSTIQTSDQNQKQQIAALTDAEMTAAKAISKLFKTFKWNDAVEAKGDAARTHTGVIAQQVEQAMTDAGLNADDYAFFVRAVHYTDTVEGNDLVFEYDDDERTETATKHEKLAIRYPELLSFIGAATEQRLASIESRLDALEAN